MSTKDEAQRYIAKFEAERGYPLTDAEKRYVEIACDDPFGGVYNPRPAVAPTDWSGNGYLNEYD